MQQVSLYWYYFPFYWASQNIGSLITGIMTYLLLIIEIIIFTFAINKTDKKISESKFSYKWLFKYNLKLLGILVGLAIIFIILFSFITSLLNPNQAGEGIFFFIFYSIIYAPFIILGSIFISSVIPQIFIYKTYKIQLINKIFFIGLIILTSIIFTIAIVSLSTCSLNKNSHCLAVRATKTNSPELCEKANPREINRCYKQASYVSTNRELCENIGKESTYYLECIINVANNLDEPELCERTNNPDNCYVRLANIYIGTDDFCKNVHDEESIEQCNKNIRREK